MEDVVITELLKYNPKFTSSEIDVGLKCFKFKTLPPKEIILQMGNIFHAVSITMIQVRNIPCG